MAQQQVHTIRHQNPQHMPGMQFHPQAAGPGGQQGGTNPQVIQPNAAASNQYVQPGTQHPYLMTGPVPIVQQVLVYDSYYFLTLLGLYKIHCKQW